MAILVMLVIFGPMGIDIYLPSFTVIQDYFNTTADYVQYTLSLFVLSMGLCQLIVGPMVDRCGRRRVVLAGIALYAATALLGAMAQSIDMLIIARILQGASACCTTTVAFSVVRDIFNARQSAQAYSYLNGALNLSPALAPMIGGFLSTTFAWQASFLFMVAFAITAFTIVWFKLPETRPKKFEHPSLSIVSSYKVLLTSPVFMINTLCCMGAMTFILSYVSSAPQLLIGQLGLSEFAFSLLFGANALGIMVSSILAGRYMHSLGESSCTLMGCLLMAVGAVGMLASYWLYGVTAAGFIVPVMVASAGFAWLLGASTGRAIAGFSHIAGTASALLVCIQMLGAALISILMQASPFRLPINLSVLMAVVGIFPLIPVFFFKKK